MINYLHILYQLHYSNWLFTVTRLVVILTNFLVCQMLKSVLSPKITCHKPLPLVHVCKKRCCGQCTCIVWWTFNNMLKLLLNVSWSIIKEKAFNYKKKNILGCLVRYLSCFLIYNFSIFIIHCFSWWTNLSKEWEYFVLSKTNPIHRNSVRNNCL